MTHRADQNGADSTNTKMQLDMGCEHTYRFINATCITGDKKLQIAKYSDNMVSTNKLLNSIGSIEDVV